MRGVLAVLFCLSLCTFVTPSTAQVSGAQVNMDCGVDDHVPVDPFGVTNYSIQCVLSNPTAYVEKIATQAEVDDWTATVFPEEVDIEAGGSVQISVNLSWNQADYHETRQLIVTAHVLELNNVPPPNSATAQSNPTVRLTHNYTANGCITSGNAGHPEAVELQMQNGLGNITVLLNHTAAPIHANNFALLATMGCYDNTGFHRIIDDFMIQGGDFTNGDGTGGHAASWQGYCNGQPNTNSSCGTSGNNAWTIPDEVDNGLLHEPCTISMAKTSAADTGGSQFFLIPEDSTPSWLDGVHTVFGTITEGCDHVTAISEVATAEQDRPVEDVRLVSATFVGSQTEDPWYRFW